MVPVCADAGRLRGRQRDIVVLGLQQREHENTVAFNNNGRLLKMDGRLFHAVTVYELRPALDRGDAHRAPAHDRGPASGADMAPCFFV